MHKVKQWDYKTKDGNVVGHVNRLENEHSPKDGKTRKQIIPHFKADGQMGIPDDFPAQHRLYGRETVHDFSKPIFIVEGEKCAYALRGLGYQALTSLGGSAQAHLADWSVLKAAKQIYLLPDNDVAGENYAAAIYAQIKAYNSDIRIVRCSSTPKGDICDYFKSLPFLKDWNEFDSLASHLHKEAIKQEFAAFLKAKAQEVPASWKFITTKHNHKLITLNDFKGLKLPKRHMLLFPWLPEGSINMIFADRGIGKTFFALSCALALANGDEFLCYSAEAAVPVLYLDGEMQATAIQQRLQKLSQGKPTKAPLTLYTPDCQENDYIPDLGTQAGRDQIDELVEATNPRVIFLDNLSSFDRSGNENEAESWAPIQAWAIQHRKKGRSVIFIHHANKEGKQRGSHKKEDVMDAVIKLKRPDDDIATLNGTKILIQYTKARHLSGEEAQDIEATLCRNDEENHLEWQWEQGDILYRQAVEMLKNKVPYRDIAEELSLGKSTVHRWKAKAQREELL